ncbi:MAG: PQQ-dependent sugar dehydrogenase, partial [Chloroflexi bacterium]|nr:PQQ-dependent sugar dehydrogenase [Chloroflexota bacterium]
MRRLRVQPGVFRLPRSARWIFVAAPAAVLLTSVSLAAVSLAAVTTVPGCGAAGGAHQRPKLAAPQRRVRASAARAAPVTPQSGPILLTGRRAMGDWRTDAPGVRRLITVRDLPPPFATPSVNNHPRISPRPPGVIPRAPAGFTVSLFASGLNEPRKIITAPDGDLFVAETRPGRILVFRQDPRTGRLERESVFASGLYFPFGLAFYPPGPNPRYLYVGDTTSVVRFPYVSGDLRARGARQPIGQGLPGYARLPGGGHMTRDVVFSPDGRDLFVSVGSRTNDAERGIAAEFHRADILELSPDGRGEHVYASGLRNAVGLAIQPGTGQLWASVNERDGLGDNLPPDYITRVAAGGFYGWPWFYIGGHPDPRHRGAHPELRSRVIVPDVLVQAHSASLNLTFYTGSSFPASYRGDI